MIQWMLKNNRKDQSKREKFARVFYVGMHIKWEGPESSKHSMRFAKATSIAFITIIIKFNIINGKLRALTDHCNGWMDGGSIKERFGAGPA